MKSHGLLQEYLKNVVNVDEGALGIPKPVVVRKDEKSETERYFRRHPIFTDHPEVIASYGRGGKGVLRNRPADSRQFEVR